MAVENKQNAEKLLGLHALYEIVHASARLKHYHHTFFKKNEEYRKK